MPSTKPLLVVVGATGLQGGGVISHFLSLNPQPYRLRGITRDPSSSAAKALVEKGVEMVSANLSDLTSLTQGFNGARAIFSVTDFWGPFRSEALRTRATAEGKTFGVAAYEAERQQGINIFEAASKVEHLDRLVFSSLCDVTKWTDGKYPNVYNYDSKAHAVEHAKTAFPDVFAKTSILQMGFYLENFLPGNFSPFPAKKVSLSIHSWHELTLWKDSDGVMVFDVLGADFLCKVVSSKEDTGPIVHAMLQSSASGLNVVGYRDMMQLSKIAELFGEINNVRTKLTIDPKHADKTPEEVKQQMADLREFVLEIGLFAEAKDTSLISPDEVSVMHPCSTPACLTLLTSAPDRRTLEVGKHRAMDEETGLVGAVRVIS
jgi:hypothetical protein